MVDRLSAMRAMAAKQPDNPLARFGLANELLKAGLHAEAEVELAAYLDRHDDEGNAWMRYADVLHHLGRVEAARAAANRGIVAAQQHGHGGMVSELEARLDEWAAD
ncbi:MAG: tetratricopeptide repeat protein [Gemmatimonadaceae bacterium]|nr:tetratricopeptide repeat protein [Gemmatimonadaceae bacterium]